MLLHVRKGQEEIEVEIPRGSRVEPVPGGAPVLIIPGPTPVDTSTYVPAAKIYDAAVNEQFGMKLHTRLRSFLARS